MTKTLLATSTEQPLDRAIAILNALATSARAMSVTELATACELPVTTVHRMASQLEKRDLIKRMIGSKKFIVGPSLVRLGNAATEAAMRSDRPHQILIALANEVGESCQIGVRSDDEVVYIDNARTAPAPGLHFEQGRRSPIHCTSIGKLYLAEMKKEEFDWWLSSATLPRLTPNTLASKQKLSAAIEDVRNMGWASNNEEFLPGLVGCAVPIRLSNGKLLACIGLYVPTARISFDRIKDFLPPLRAAAEKIATIAEGKPE
ncbi:MAG: IclR family transcriptional regulator [Burkholderiaceae bacterium]|nr:IclR family transcriptional regulator [Burkholderiaceae bacterium]